MGLFQLPPFNNAKRATAEDWVVGEVDFVLNPANEAGCVGRGVAVSQGIEAEGDEAGGGEARALWPSVH